MANDDLQADLTLELSSFRRGLQEALKAAQNLGSTMRSVSTQVTTSLRGIDNGVNHTKRNLSELERIASGIVLAQGFYGAKTAIEDAAVSLVTFIDDLDRAQISLDYFLKTPEQATAFLEDVKDFAAETAFDTNQALLLSRRLLSGGFKAPDIRNTLETLNDALAASGLSTEKLDNLVLALTQVRTNGKLAGQELRQLGETGLDIRGILQEKFGLTGEQLNNVGDLNIDGNKAVDAILEGLEERYGGAAERLADTLFAAFDSIRDGFKILGDAAFEAPYAAVLGAVLRVRDIIEQARNLLREKGLGGVLEGLFPPEVHTAIRAITGSLKSLGQSLKNIAAVVGPVAQATGVILLNALGLVLPVIAGLVRLITAAARAAIEAVPGLKFLGAAIVGLLVVQGTTRALVLFWRVLRLGLIAEVVAKAVFLLARAVRTLTLALLRSPLGIVIALGAGLLYVTGAADLLFKALDRVVQKISQIGGFKFDEQLPVEDIKLIDSIDFEGTGADVGGDFGAGFEEAAEKEADKFRKYLASFDEVFQVPEDESDALDAGAAGNLGGLNLPKPEKITLDDLGLEDLPDKIELPEFVYPPLPATPTIPPIQIPTTILGPTFAPGFKLPALGPISVPVAIALPSLAPVGGFVKGIRDALDPGLKSIQGFADSLKGILSGFPAFAGGIVGTVGATIGGLIGALGNAIPPLSTFQGAFKNLLETVGDFGINLGSVLETVGDFRINLAPLIETVGDFGINLGRVVETVGDFGINLTPLIETVGNFGAYMGDLIETVGDFGINLGLVSGELPLLAALFGTVGGAILFNITDFETWRTSVGASVAGVFDGIKTFATNFTSQIPGAVRSGLDTIAAFWQQHRSVIINVGALILTGLLTVFTGGLGGIAAFIVGWIPRAAQLFTRFGPLVASTIRGIPALFTNIWGAVARTVPQAISGIVTFFRGLPGQIFDAIKSIPSQVASVFSNIKLPSFSSAVEGVKATFNRIGPIAGFASGGIIGKDSIVRVGEQGKREAIIPLQNQSAMQPFVDAVVQGLQQSGNGRSNPNPGTEDGEPPTILYVANLIADDRGLKELERRMKVVRLNENKRGGYTT